MSKLRRLPFLIDQSKYTCYYNYCTRRPIGATVDYPVLLVGRDWDLSAHSYAVLFHSFLNKYLLKSNRDRLFSYLEINEHDTYRQRLKLSKPAVLRSKNWSSREAVEELRDCLDNTDWDISRTSANSMDEYTEAVTSYISFCEDRCIPTSTRVSYNNDKPLFTTKLKQLRLDKEGAFKSVGKDRFILAKYSFGKKIKEAKCETVFQEAGTTICSQRLLISLERPPGWSPASKPHPPTLWKTYNLQTT